MRKELKYILWAHAALVVFLIWYTFDLITLLHDDTFQDALLDVELNPVDGTLDKEKIIPKIIHQTYKTTNIPEMWKPGQQACIDLHPDYQYILWTDDMARQFIAEKFSWFLETWDSYPYPIQRADAIRYFALAHHGGIYIDLDDGCERRLDPLLTVPAFVRKTVPTGISNDVMGSVPRHPFFLKVMSSLASYQHNWLVPYITIMYSTGPLFLSVIWKQYKRGGVPEAGKVRILLPEDYKTHSYSFFAIAPGSSWHLDDAKFIKSLANHIGLAVFVGFLIAGIVFYCEWAFYQWCIGNYSISKSNYRWNWWNNFLRRKLNHNIKKRSRKDSNLPPHYQVDLDLDKLDDGDEVEKNTSVNSASNSGSNSQNNSQNNSTTSKHIDNLV